MSNETTPSQMNHFKATYIGDKCTFISRYCTLHENKMGH